MTRIIILFLINLIAIYVCFYNNFSDSSILLYEGSLKLGELQLVSIILLLIFSVLHFLLFSSRDNFQTLCVLTLLSSLVFILESNDLLVTFISIELLNFTLYLLIGKYTNGIKYFILSSIMSTILLLAITLYYANFGNTNYDVILLFSSSEFNNNNIGTSLLLLVLIFKLGLFPFHQLTADLYDGISTPIMVLFQIPVKYTIVILSMLLPFTYELTPLGLSKISMTEILGVLLLLSMIIPAIQLNFQYTFKRFIALSSVSYQAMLLFLILVSTSTNIWYDIYNYLFIYSLSIIVIMALISQYKVLNYGSYVILTLVFLSISGLPPFAGFYAKLYILQDALMLFRDWNIYVITIIISSLIMTSNYLLFISNLAFVPTPKLYSGIVIQNSQLIGTLASILFSWWLF